MAILLTCPGCRQQMTIPDESRGATVRCPACTTMFPSIQDSSHPYTAIQVAMPPSPMSGPGYVEVASDRADLARPSGQPGQVRRIAMMMTSLNVGGPPWAVGREDERGAAAAAGGRDQLIARFAYIMRDDGSKQLALGWALGIEEIDRGAVVGQIFGGFTGSLLVILGVATSFFVTVPAACISILAELLEELGDVMTFLREQDWFPRL